MDEDVTKSFFSDFYSIEKGIDVHITQLDAYFYDGDYYYNAKFSATDEGSGECVEWDMVYRRQKYGARFVMFINLKWENWGDALRMKDEFYDAVEYGKHKSFTYEEISGYSQMSAG
ncbi:MAG: hypothetical protein IKB34_00330 [Clostridia bacterium]|nr:hypothetical protein [Clostridia bacterium]